MATTPGSKVGAIQSVANNAVLTIQPAGQAEYTIHNIHYGGAVQLIFTDGTNTINSLSDSSAGGMFGYNFNVTNALYLTIKNVSGGTILIGFDGVITA
jgi:hypothetical protein